MITERKTSLTMLLLLLILVFIYHLGIGIYYAKGLEPLPTFEFLYRAGFLCGVVWWMKAETRMSPAVSIYCPGVLVGMGWLIAIPYYLFKTRGPSGLLIFLALIGIMVVSQLLVQIVHVVTSMM